MRHPGLISFTRDSKDSRGKGVAERKDRKAKTGGSNFKWFVQSLQTSVYPSVGWDEVFTFNSWEVK